VAQAGPAEACENAREPVGGCLADDSGGVAGFLSFPGRPVFCGPLSYAGSIPSLSSASTNQIAAASRSSAVLPRPTLDASSVRARSTTGGAVTGAAAVSRAIVRRLTPSTAPTRCGVQPAPYSQQRTQFADLAESAVTERTVAAGAPTSTKRLDDHSQGTPLFLCYRREDTQDAVGRLHDRLLAAYGPDRVFMDIDSVPSCPHGHSALSRASCRHVGLGRSYRPRGVERRDENGR
jgi:hypothetical protein